MTQETETRYDMLVDLYQIDYGHVDDDFAMYTALAAQTGGPVLELGAGGGRLTLHLARTGHDVTAIERSAAAAGYLRCKSSDLTNVQVVEADIRDFELGTQFGLVCAGYGAVHHLLTSDDQRACFRSVARHLLPGGLFVFDLRAIFATDWDMSDSAPLLHDWTRTMDDGSTMTKLRSVTVDRATQIQHETYYFDRTSADGTLHRTVASVDLRFSTRYEMEAVLHDAGLVVHSVFGDYDMSPYESDSQLMITVCGREPAS